MKDQLFRGKWTYFLLSITFASTILALTNFGFLFKSGVAGAGILILLYLYCKQLNHSKDVLAIFGAFLLSIAGDWFLSNRHGEVVMFMSGIALFFLAHIGYLSFALMNGRLNRIYTLLILGIYLVFFFQMLYPGIQDKTLKMAVLFYLLISCFSLGAAIGISESNWFKWLYVLEL